MVWGAFPKPYWKSIYGPCNLLKDPGLKPLVFFWGLGMALATGYLIRLTTRNPDCCIDRKNNPHPWQKLSPNGQYKMVSITQDYKNLKLPEERPDID